MKVLILGQHYYPEEISGAVLATELAEFLVEEGHEVTFITCVPNYPYGEPYKSYKNRLFQKENIRGVEVIRTWSYISPKKTFWRRILNYGTFSLFVFFAGLFVKKPDLIYAYSPPLPLGVTAWLLSIFKRAPWVLRVEDLYPDAAVSAGVLKNKLAIRFFYWLEKFIYDRVDRLSVLSDGFKEIVQKKGIDPAKIYVTPVWANPEEIIDNGLQTQFRKAQGFKNEFIVLYAGNIGQTSDLEIVIEAAEHLQQNKDIHFVFIGEGIKKKSLIDLAAQKQLNNVRFLPYQPRQMFADMMTSANLFIVTINIHSSRYSLPGKTFNCMASARPILAVSPQDSELAELVNLYQCGYVVEPEDSHRIADQILYAFDHKDQLHQMGQNGRQALENNFARDVCLQEVKTILFSDLI